MSFHSITALLRFLAVCLVLLGFTLPAQAAISVSDNNTHVDRGVLYNNLAFLTASGGVAPYTFSVTAGLPIGLTVASDGTVSGLTCGSNGNFGITLTVTDSTSATASPTNLSIIVNAAPAGGCSLTFTSSTLPSGAVGVAYNGTVTATGGTTPTYSVASGSLPPGLSLNSSSGAITGTPSSAQTSTFTIYVSDTSGNTGSQTYSITIAASAPTITLSPTSLTAGTAGTSYSQSFTASGGTSPYTYAVTSGALPTGLSLSSGGALTGTPTVAGSYSFTIQATDANSYTGSQALSLTINTPTIAVSPTTLTAGTAGTSYSQTITASGGGSPYSYAVSSGSLPTGMSLSSGGVLSGTPTVAGSYNFVVRATDNNTYTGSRAYTWTINTPTIAVSPTSLSAGTAGTSYSQTITASGGASPYTYTISSGSLPTGMSLNSNGTLSGTPSVAGSYNFTVTATDANGYTGSQALSWTINTPTITLSPTSLAASLAGASYSQTFTASGGASPYSYALTSGALPTGLSLSSGGVLSGTPTVAGSYNFTITATDNNGYTGSQALALTINSTTAIALSPTSLSAGTDGTSYSQTFTGSGGTGPYAYAVTSGTLPTGLSLSSGGALTGTPSVPGSYSFSITATDANSYTGSQALSLTINAAPTVSVSLGGVSSGTAGSSYSQTFAASGGTGPYTYTVSAGSLPPGITLNSSTGVLSGTPTVAGPYSFTVTATDNNGYTGTQAVSFTVNAAPTITLSPTSLAAGTTANSYNQTFTASGGTGPYTYAVTSGALPAGLTLSSGGALSGTPSATGSYNFTITATDANSYTGSQALSLTVNTTPTISVSPASLSAGALGASYSQTFTASGGTGPYTYAVTSGSLPAGLSLSSGGALTGTPSTVGNYIFTITATDNNAFTGSQALTFAIGQTDPTQERDFRALLANEVSVIERFTGTQITNVARRLEDLHDGTESASELCISTNNNPRPGVVVENDRQITEVCPQTKGAKSLLGVSTWISGTLEYGNQSASATQSSSRFSTKGITLGADYRMPDNRVVGIALGYGFDDVKVGEAGSNVGAQNLNLIGYGGWKPFPNVFIDAMGGLGNTSLDAQRRVELDNSLASGERNANGVFSAFIVSAAIKAFPFQMATYFRSDYLNARLASYQETGAATQALAYDSASLQSTSMTLGVRASYPMLLAGGKFEPGVRLEYQGRYEDAVNQVVHYVNNPGSNYTYTLPENRQQIAAIGLSARYALARLGVARIEFQTQYSDGAILSRSVRGNLAMSF